MKDIMKCILTIILVVISWSLVVALQAIHVEDPEEDQRNTESPATEKNSSSLFLSVIPVQETATDDLSNQTISQTEDVMNGAPGRESESNLFDHHFQTASSSATSSSSDSDIRAAHDHFRNGLVVNNQQRPTLFTDISRGHTTQGGGRPSPEFPVHLTNPNDGPAKTLEEKHRDESSDALRSITVSSGSNVADNSDHQAVHRHQQREISGGGKEFVPSPQLGQWSDEHDFKRILVENDNVFYPMRQSQQDAPQSPSIGGGGGDHFSDKPMFINELPAPKFHSTNGGGGHLGPPPLVGSLNKHYPKFTEFVAPPSEIPHYVLQRPERPFRFPDDATPTNHRTTQWHNNNNKPEGPNKDPGMRDVRVLPLTGEDQAIHSSSAKNGGHLSTSFIHSQTQPDHPYAFDFGHDESAATSFSKDDRHHHLIEQQQQQQFGKIPPLEFYDLNEFEKFPFKKEELHFPPPTIPHHGKKHGRPPAPWKKIVHVMAAAIPLGLVISALTPHVVYVNPNDTSIGRPPLATIQRPFPSPPLPHPAFVTYYPRLRALMEGEGGFEWQAIDNENSTLKDFLSELSSSLAQIPGAEQCEDRAFCEMARMGRKPDALQPHKMLWRIANETTDSQIRKAGMKHIFRAIKDGHCEKIKCKKT